MTPVADPMPLLESRIINKEIDIYMKRRSTLDENVQNSYPLVLGQCTDLLKSKLKQSNKWHVASKKYDVLILIRIIRTITFKFDEQKYLPLALHQEKANFYNIRQGSLSNAEYLEKFNNVVDIATTYNRQLNDQAITDIATETSHAGVDYVTLIAPQQAIVQENAKDMYLVCTFLCQSDRKVYGMLLEELDKNYTKGNSNYPTNLVIAYRMISEYKNWQPRSSVTESDGVPFSQQARGRTNNVNQIKDWMKDKECYKCGQKFHIATLCPPKKSNSDLDDDNKSKKSSLESFKKKESQREEEKRNRTICPRRR